MCYIVGAVVLVMLLGLICTSDEPRLPPGGFWPACTPNPEAPGAPGAHRFGFLDFFLEPCWTAPDPGPDQGPRPWRSPLVIPADPWVPAFEAALIALMADVEGQVTLQEM